MEGVQFSEQAWKEFLKFMTSVVEGKQANVSDEAAADKLVEEYYRHKGSDDHIDLVADLVEVFMQNKGTASTAEIVGLLNSNGYKHSSRSASALMTKVMRRRPSISKEGRATYIYVGGVE